RAEQTQQPIIHTTQPQAEVLSANSLNELTNPAMRIENAAVSATCPSSGPGTHTEVPLQCQPYTRGFFQEPEAPRANDPQNRIHGTTTR
ncbi:Hypothetical predicted protein, partial [Pelobates cultripes]